MNTDVDYNVFGARDDFCGKSKLSRIFQKMNLKFTLNGHQNYSLEVLVGWLKLANKMMELFP